jgi:mono/diheme cytochrome c family protein
MKIRIAIFSMLALVLLLTLAAAAKTGAEGKDKDKDTPGARTGVSQDDTTRLQGEQRFRSNCGRCHTAPPKFAPRMMGTIVRHMRVRAMLTDEDARLILRYMSH